MTSTVPLNFTLLPLFSAKMPPTVGRQVSVTVEPLELLEDELDELLLEDELLEAELDELPEELLDEEELLLDEELLDELLLEDELDEALEAELEELLVADAAAPVEPADPDESALSVRAWSGRELKLNPWFFPQPVDSSANERSA